MLTRAKLSVAAILLALVVLLPATSVAQTRIQIPRGRYSTTVTGTLPYGYYRTYVVRARAGQSIVAKVVSPTGQVVFAEDYGHQYFLDLVEDGDYFIQIMNVGPRSSYRLTVTIVRTPR
jgi:hypothetical protein